jgi:hypothetical protein
MCEGRSPCSAWQVTILNSVLNIFDSIQKRAQVSIITTTCFDGLLWSGAKGFYFLFLDPRFLADRRKRRVSTPFPLLLGGFKR